MVCIALRVWQRRGVGRLRGRFRTARAQRQLSREHPCKPRPYISVRDHFKTASFRTLGPTAEPVFTTHRPSYPSQTKAKPCRHNSVRAHIAPCVLSAKHDPTEWCLRNWATLYKLVLLFIATVIVFTHKLHGMCPCDVSVGRNH